MDSDFLRDPLGSQENLGHAGVGNEEGIVDKLRRKTMKARKILAAIGAALIMISVSAPASAFECGTDPVTDPYNKDVIAAGLKALAITLRCDDDDSDANPGEWINDPIWERRRTADCEVHLRLARKLHEDRELDDDSTKPPKKKNNLVAGASWDVMFEKYEGALSKLDSFLNDASKARLNSKFPGGTDNAAIARNWFTSEVEEARICVNHFVL